MCGISAIWSRKGKPVDIEAIQAMVKSLHHRGPDESGYASFEDKRLWLGHARLSVIDLKTGQQPMYSNDRRFCIVFNGELYDYQKHRSALQLRGHTFRTQSDTEVVLHLFEEYGVDCFKLLNGEFAILIWDSQKKELVAAKDRFGVKPLFFWQDSQKIAFGSEIKAILSLRDVPRSLSPEYFMSSFFTGHVPSVTPFSEVVSLKPGHFLRVTNSEVIQEQPYWQPTFEIQDMPIESALTLVRENVEAAVHRRMIADVPVGTYLSGGLDSTLVCAIMSRKSSAVRAFNVGFSGSVYNEAPLAKRVAEFYGVAFDSVDCRDEDLADNVIKTVSHIEAPLPNPNSIAKQMLSAFIGKQGYKVCITGEGADEMFGGYQYFKLERLWQMLHSTPDERAVAKTLLRRFTKDEARSEGFHWDRKLSLLEVKKDGFPYNSFPYSRLKPLDKLCESLLQQHVLDSGGGIPPSERFSAQFDRAELSKLDSFNVTKRLSFPMLSDYMLTALGDRVEMANSVECRTPFLDPQLVNVVSTIPPRHFMDIARLREKSLLRDAFKDLLPPFLENERKHPFLAPSWKGVFKTKRGKELLNTYCSDEAIRKAGIFRPKTVQQMRLMWSILPKSSIIWRKIDFMIGLITTTHCMHDLFIERR